MGIRASRLRTTTCSAQQGYLEASCVGTLVFCAEMRWFIQCHETSLPTSCGRIWLSSRDTCDEIEVVAPVRWTFQVKTLHEAATPHRTVLQDEIVGQLTFSACPHHHPHHGPDRSRSTRRQCGASTRFSTVLCTKQLIPCHRKIAQSTPC